MPAPVGGWNTRDDRGNMPQRDAEVLVNLIPDTATVKLRAGHAQHAFDVGTSADVLTIAEYNNQGGTVKLIVANTSAIFDATVATSATLIKEAPFTNGSWDTINFNGEMLLANGADTVQRYNGTSCDDWTATGPTLTNVIGLHVHKNRVYCWEDQDSSFWYGGTNSITGAFAEFSLGKIAQSGGYIVSMRSWTVDGGDGVDDFAVFIMSTGEVLVYQGDDPGTVTRWGIVGRYHIGRPLSRDGFTNYGGNLVCITDLDYVTVPQAFKTEGSIPPTKLAGALQDEIASYGAVSGWQAVYHPKSGHIIFNIPHDGNTSVQHAINTRSPGAGAWKITGWNTKCFGTFNGDLYFGGLGDSKVYKAFSGSTDNGSAIAFEARTSYTNLRTDIDKTVVFYRPLMRTSGQLSATTGLAYDFSDTALFTQTIDLPSLGAQWDVAQWDVDFWAQEEFARDDWQIGAGEGTYVQYRMSGAASNTDISWYKTQMVFKLGDII
jgi:hypothetical protein